MRPRLLLLRRILVAVAIGLALTTFALGHLAEQVLEAAMLDRSKSQAGVFLDGIGRELEALPDPMSPDAAGAVLRRALGHGQAQLEFAVAAAYLYDRQGRVVVHEPPGDYPPKDMSGRYGAVLASGVPYLGEEVEYETAADGSTVPQVDVIVPVRHDGRVVGGLEAELDLRRTEEAVRRLDDGFEQRLFAMFFLTGLLLLGFVGAVVYRGMVGPVRRLGETTHRIAAGDLSARVGREADDELGFLGRAVDRMADSIEGLFREQEAAYLGTLQALAKALEAKDAYTASHSGRVTRYSLLLGRRIGLPEEELALLRQGALMHDLGKIGIPDSILNKPGPLDDHEFEVIKSHPEMTDSIMRPLKRFAAFAEIARWHHERWDGKGYPDGLAGEAIPLLARIVAIADTWDAMTGDRVYRKGMPEAKALAILEAERDSGQWDPALLDDFIALVREERSLREQVAAGRAAADVLP